MLVSSVPIKNKQNANNKMFAETTDDLPMNRKHPSDVRDTAYDVDNLESDEL